MDWRVLYTIKNLLKRRFLKWACMTHMDIWNTSYDQKKGWESNRQFDSRPLKVKNRLDFLMCRWSMTYHWKVLDKGYNFALDFIWIGGLHTKLWAPKVTRVPIMGILKLPLGRPETKCHLDVGPMANHRVYYKGEGGGFPQSKPWWVFWVWVCPWFVLAPKVFQLCTSQLVIWFVHIHVSDYVLVIFPSPISELQHALLPQKCCKPRNVLRFLALPLFSLQTHIWVYPGVWKRVNFDI
jgi:hypothetical protein